MKKLVIAEKPSVARDLAKILGANSQNRNYFEGKDYIVTWALGHLLTLKMPEEIKKEWGQWKSEDLPMIPKNIGIKPLPKTTAQLKAISTLSKRKDVSSAIIATDAGREGELVARWILEWIRFPKPVERLWISSQTTKAVKEGFSKLKPAKAYDHLYDSAIGRSKADWLIGLNVTRALTTHFNDNLSAGRVQTPTLSLVRAEEEKQEKFIAQTYYRVELVYQDFHGRLVENKTQFLSREDAEKIVQKLQGKIGKVVSVETKEKSIPAPLPYDLTELQQVANAQYGFSAKMTLSLVQSLYETHKVVSYPRTDSKYLPSDLKQSMHERLQAVVSFDPTAKQHIKNGSVVTNAKVFNDAKISDHYALIPTEETPKVARMSSEEVKIYRLIVERFLALFAEKHILAKTKCDVKFDSGEVFEFAEEVVVQQGWKTRDEKNAPTIDFSAIKSMKGNFAIQKKVTTPPKSLTEGTLLAKMEKFGLGTPATRAEIIERLIKSELMLRSGQSLSVTPKGKQLLTLVNPALKSPEMTAKWEKELEEIAKGRQKVGVFLNEIEKETKRLVKEILASEVTYKDFSITQKRCPECNEFLREKNTKTGKFLICSNATCNYKRRAQPQVSNHRCPTCHKKMEIIEGKNGAFFRCKFDGTTEKMLDKKERNKKISKHEERRLLQKVNAQKEPEESALAIALKKALGES